MPTFFDLLKYAKTGIAAPDMTAYDKAKALAMCGGGLSPYTIIGQPPISFLSDGTPLTSVTIKGNGQQSGTPSPQNILPFDGTGERTGNLFDINATPTKYSQDTTVTVSGRQLTITGKWYIYYVIDVTPNTDYYVNWSIDYSEIEGRGSIAIISDESPSTVIKQQTTTPFTFNSGSNNRIRMQIYCASSTSGTVILSDIMLVSGSTAPTSYIPYGWQIPLTCAGQTTPLYLGEVSTERRVWKWVLTGDETWYVASTGSKFYSQPSSAYRAMVESGVVSCACSHYAAQQNVTSGLSVDNLKCAFRTNLAFYIGDDAFATTTDFKAFLAQEYAAGHPVTIWYVLATEQTGIVNEPLMKIGDYCDELTTTTPIPTAKGSNELTVDTTLAPSEVSITGNIKPV